MVKAVLTAPENYKKPEHREFGVRNRIKFPKRMFKIINKSPGQLWNIFLWRSLKTGQLWSSQG